MAAFATGPDEECWVLKLGGSLISRPNLAEHLQSVIRRTSRKPLLVVGGGLAADQVRSWEAIHHLDAAKAHWLAIRAMEFNARLIEALLPETKFVGGPDDVRRVWDQGCIAMLDAFGWLKSAEESRPLLPHSWDVTSDSIAAYAALAFRASGLLLLKSVEMPSSIISADPMGEPFVDAHFHRLAPKIPQIAWCNLSAEPLEIKTASRKS